MGRKVTREYAIYKGDELLVIGTARECAEKLGVQLPYIHWLMTPTAKRRLAQRKNPERCVVGEVIKEEDEECETRWGT